jgi:hypothetical protein
MEIPRFSEVLRKALVYLYFSFLKSDIIKKNFGK